MLDTQPTERERLRRFSELLKEARRRIPTDTLSLGNTLRISERIGKRVSQEEVAEVIGISRVWYATLEMGRPRASIAVLGRICDALMLDEDQRAHLLQLCVPELASIVRQVRVP
jgi:DNA-binding XRE family transcriptional regulator